MIYVPVGINKFSVFFKNHFPKRLRDQLKWHFGLFLIYLNLFINLFLNKLVVALAGLFQNPKSFFISVASPAFVFRILTLSTFYIKAGVRNVFTALTQFVLGAHDLSDSYTSRHCDVITNTALTLQTVSNDHKMHQSLTGV